MKFGMFSVESFELILICNKLTQKRMLYSGSHFNIVICMGDL